MVNAGYKVETGMPSKKRKYNPPPGSVLETSYGVEPEKVKETEHESNIPAWKKAMIDAGYKVSDI
jgi:hypothetical protein